MWHAIRYRSAQSITMVLLAALVVAAAALGPLYSRSLERSLLKSAIDAATLQDTSLVMESASSGKDRVSGDALVAPGPLASSFGGGSLIYRSSLTIRNGSSAGGPVEAPFLAMGDGCAHLIIRSGICPSRPDEVLISAESAQSGPHAVGGTLQVVFAVEPPSGPGQDFAASLKIVGTYEQKPDPAFWFGTRLNRGASPHVVVVDMSFFSDQTGGWNTSSSVRNQGQVKLDMAVARQVPLLRPSLDIADVDPLMAAIRSAEQASSFEVTTTSSLDSVLAEVQEGRRQAGLLVTLLLAQLALLSVTVLGLAAAAAVETRRPEMALARLRGRGRAGARRLVVRELGVLVLIGTPLGLVAALLANELARRTWLPGGVPFEVTRDGQLERVS